MPNRPSGFPELGLALAGNDLGAGRFLNPLMDTLGCVDKFKPVSGGGDVDHA